MPSVKFTGDIFRRQKYGGVSKYFTRLITGLQAFTEFSVSVDLFLHVNRHINRKALNRSHLVSPLRLDSPLLNSRAKQVDSWILRKVREEVSDILHETFFLEDEARNEAKYRVVTVYDTIREMFGPHTSQIEKKAKSAELADHIICISKTTQIDFQRIYGVTNKRVSVIPLGVDDAPFVYRNFSLLRSSKKHQLLFIGQRDGYKNFEFLFETFCSSSELRKLFELVVVGPSFTEKEISRIERDKLQENLRHVGSSEHSLQKELNRSSALLVPSLYEGFGLPALEAMMTGCPVFSSETGAQKEILSDSSFYFNPYDPNSLCTSLLEAFSHPDKMLEMSVKGRARAKEFSWDETVDLTRKVYSQLLLN